MRDVILTGSMLTLALILFSMALMRAWPRAVAEAPKYPCGFWPPS